MTPTSARAVLRYLRTGELRFSVLRDSLIALSDASLANLRDALSAAPDLNHGYHGAADLRSLLTTVECVQHYRATNAPGIICRA
jgi:hypothetical protein